MGAAVFTVEEPLLTFRQKVTFALQVKNFFETFGIF